MSATGCVFVTAKVASKILVNSCDVDIDTSATFDSLLTNVLEIENVEIENSENRNVVVFMTTGIDIFSCRLVVVPINVGNAHW